LICFLLDTYVPSGLAVLVFILQLPRLKLCGKIDIFSEPMLAMHTSHAFRLAKNFA
jgi:hypothetical protein